MEHCGMFPIDTIKVCRPSPPPQIPSPAPPPAIN
jgi:hypothetical protein